MAKLTPEQIFTGDLSKLLAGQSWQPVEHLPGFSGRSRELEVPGVGSVALRQLCRLDALSDWENAIEISSVIGDRTFVWKQDDTSMENPGALQQTLKDLQAGIGGGGSDEAE